MTTHRVVPSEIEAEQLSELLADARAIPAAAFSPAKRAARPVIDLSLLPRQRTAVRIPETAASLLESAEHRFADFSR